MIFAGAKMGLSLQSKPNHLLRKDQLLSGAKESAAICCEMISCYVVRKDQLPSAGPSAGKGSAAICCEKISWHPLGLLLGKDQLPSAAKRSDGS